MADVSQSQARAAAIAKGASAADVDAFIAKEGGARTSAQRIASAFGVAGAQGTNDLTTFHAQKTTAAGADASGKGTYLSGATGPAEAASPGGGGGTGAPIVDPGTPAMAGISAAAGGGDGGAAGGGSMVTSPDSSQLRAGLGRRIPPQDAMTLAALKSRAY